MWPVPSFILLLSVTLLAVAEIDLVSTETKHYEPIFICPLKRCSCPSKTRLIAPGVGFALEMSYGTVSIKYENGTIAPVAQVAAPADYIALMEHLATSPIKRMHDGSRPPPGVDESENKGKSLWIRFHIVRFIKKLLWLPSTPEVKTLANMATKLRREAETKLGRRVKGAAMSSPDRVRLTRQEIGDIFDYLRMEDLVAEKDNFFFNELTSMAAASAGYGDGLCKIYTNAYECTVEERHAPYLEILQLDYSQSALTAALGGANTVRRSYCGNTFVDLDLGNAQLLVEGSSEGEYWHRVEKRIRDFAGSSRLDRLMLTGESASDPRFIQAIKNALSMAELPLGFDIHFAPVSNHSEYFLFATSIGAAELAKRRQEGMGNCWLPEKCRGERVSEDIEAVKSEL
ncbi:hypothetical protein BKA64DRAFT_682540 [Cadophora sp. MPI-SDFR-AT-0126]|nr:hypothetical protein BKA64DRAFT_682540 [Leotiomycetes sp. MPI-SDFR-AT-0126]